MIFSSDRLRALRMAWVALCVDQIQAFRDLIFGHRAEFPNAIDGLLRGTHSRTAARRLSRMSALASASPSYQPSSHACASESTAGTEPAMPLR